MADPLLALEEINAEIAALLKLVSTGKAEHLKSSRAQPFVSAIATKYFEAVRADLDKAKSRAGIVDEIDFLVENMLQLVGADREKRAYIGLITELRPLLVAASIDLMKYRGTRVLVLSQTERAILDTLIAMKLPCSSSYEQSLYDISQGSRISWRGTATELRETLREVMDHLAPDDKVTAAAGFQFENGLTRPTQKQKVRYILRARRSSRAAAEAALEIVEEAVGALARSTYQRGSISTHVGSNSTEIKNLKRYVDALLGELLEAN